MGGYLPLPFLIVSALHMAVCEQGLAVLQRSWGEADGSTSWG